MNRVEVITIVFAYLLGSIPVGYILTKVSTGKNILEQGSGNVGSTNVKRVAGKKIALITQLLDMLKGLLPVGIYLFLARIEGITTPFYFVYALALASILGHNFSIFLKFKGGKGVNTTLGASILLAPIPVLISVLVYFIVKWQFKFVSLGSICLALSLPVSGLIIYHHTPTFYYLLICALLIVVMHHKNIKRLLSGKELR